MKAVFADTFYFLALLNQRDAAHVRAVAASREPGLSLVTTEFVLIELADALCKPRHRDEVLTLCRILETDPAFRLIPATSDLVGRGKVLFGAREDKEWPLTDCISFVVMRDTGCPKHSRPTATSSKQDSKRFWLESEDSVLLGVIVLSTRAGPCLLP